MKVWISILILFGFLLSALEANAYIGPGTGLTGLGSLIAIAGVVLVATLAFIWYPAKRFVKWITRFVRSLRSDTSDVIE